MDNLYRIQAANPELAGLMRRLKTIYAITGGEVPATTTGKKDDFNAKKSVIIAQLHNFDQLCEARDSSGLAKDSRDMIRLKVTVQSELTKLEDMVKDLAVTHEKEMRKKGAKMPAEELEARKEVMSAILREFHGAYKHAKGFAHRAADESLQTGTGPHAMTTKDLVSGNFAGAGVRTKQEAMSGEHLQALQDIQQQTAEQDQLLDEISKGLDELKDLAEKMNDELQLQDKMLDDLDSKTDKVQGKLDKTNERMKEALKLVNEKSTNMCIYIICIVLLLGMAGVAYKISQKR